MQTRTGPDILYIGLQKTGSTFLRGYFTAHPGIVWTREAYRMQSRGLEEGYPAALQSALKDRGEPSAAATVWVDMYESIGMGYQLLGTDRWTDDCMLSQGPIVGNPKIDPSSPGLFPRIHAVLPGVRVLLTIRNQVEWIFSNYHHFVHNMLKSGKYGFDDFLATIEGRIVLSVARYDALVQQLFDVFGRDNVLVVPLELIERDQENALKQISSFAGVPYVPFEPAPDHLNRGLDSAHAAGGEEFKVGNAAVPSKRALAARLGPLLAAMYAVGNVRLARLLDTDIESLGYPT